MPQHTERFHHSKHDATLDEKIAAKVWKGEPGQCWVWLAGTNGNGYAGLWVDGHCRKAGRIVYEHLVGSIPDGYILDHDCHNWLADAGLCDGGHCVELLCVNPEHLVPKPQQANLRKSPLTQASINSSKTECKRGHPFDEENTGYRANGYRYCQACNRMGRDGRAAWDAANSS